jgi:hypothetical protein
MSTHTEEPWRIGADPTEPKLHLIWTDEEGVDQMSVLVARTCFAPASEQNANRIVTCVNACRGIPAPAKALEDARKALGFLMKYARSDVQRDICRSALAALTPSQEQP